MSQHDLNSALRTFEAAEANLEKAERLLGDLEALIPNGIVFGNDTQYEEALFALQPVLDALPGIDGWKPGFELYEYQEIGQMRFDAEEIGDFEAKVYVERQLEQPFEMLREYRRRFAKKRRELVRDALQNVLNGVDQILPRLLIEANAAKGVATEMSTPLLEELRGYAKQLDVLLGSTARPTRWADFRRHLAFGMPGDIRDIHTHDWPQVKSAIQKGMYSGNDPIPVGVADLGEVVNQHPTGPIATKLNWAALDEEDFERLLFILASSDSGYENPEWLMRTNAADRGRDISVTRVFRDGLAGTIRHRIIIQCKHWQSKSVAPSDIAMLREQIKLWEPPRVDVVIIATSGRFTSDAVALVERQNLTDTALRIEMWPESHLEKLLATRPAIIAEFRLRD